MGKQRKRVALGLLSFALAVACQREESKPRPPVPVRVEVLTARDDAGGLRYSASVTPYTVVALEFEVDGYVEWIRQVAGADGQPRATQLGDPVESGLELARIDDDEYVDRVAEARAHVDRERAILVKSRDQFERSRHLFDTQSVTAPEFERARKDFETSQAGVAEAQAQLDRAQQKLDACTITSPLTGIVLQRVIEVGSFVHAGSTAFQVGDVSRVKVVFGVPDTGLAGLSPGDEIELTTASTPDRVFAGRITAIAPSADERTRVFEIEVTVPNADGALRPGMIASLNTSGEEREGLLVVPVAAVRRPADGSEGYAVAVVTGDGDASVAHLTPVTLGNPLGTGVVVLDGLSPGARVIVSGAEQVTDGAAVRVVP